MCSYCMCTCICIQCVSAISLYLARPKPHISHPGWWDFYNLSKSVNSWLHGANDRYRLTGLYLQGLFRCSLCVRLCVVLYPYASAFVEIKLHMGCCCFLLYCNRYGASEGNFPGSNMRTSFFFFLLFIISIWLDTLRKTGTKVAFVLVQTGH